MLSDILSSLPLIQDHHSRQTSLYRILDRATRRAAEELFEPEQRDNVKVLGTLGSIFFPYVNMGAVDSIDLFGLDELMLFSFYWVNRNRYKKVLDIGANIGLHSVILAKCGYQVRSFEPDPTHFAKLQEILTLNGIQTVEANQAAVSDRDGEVEFVRVLGNTTSSHIAGCKHPYGELERFKVPVFNIKNLIQDADLIKMDVEGHEGTLIQATSSDDWNHTDALIEVGTLEIAKAILDHLQRINVRAFSQKIGWREVKTLDDMPFSYKDGSLFISKKSSMPWKE